MQNTVTSGITCQVIILVILGLKLQVDLVCQFNYNGTIIADREDQMQNPTQVSVYRSIDKMLAFYGTAIFVALAGSIHTVVTHV